MLIDQSRCRGYRKCVEGCPYKKSHYRPTTRTSEKCLAYFPRVHGKDPDVTPERPDQIVVELEFLARLIELEEQARRQALHGETPQRRQVELERAAICLDARRRFFTEHLGWWAPGLARLLIEGDSHPFYQAGGRFLATLLTAQRALLGVAPSQRVAVPSPPEETGPCDDCLVADLGPN